MKQRSSWDCTRHHLTIMNKDYCSLCRIEQAEGRVTELGDVLALIRSYAHEIERGTPPGDANLCAQHIVTEVNRVLGPSAPAPID